MSMIGLATQVLVDLERRLLAADDEAKGWSALHAVVERALSDHDAHEAELRAAKERIATLERRLALYEDGTPTASEFRAAEPAAEAE